MTGEDFAVSCGGDCMNGVSICWQDTYIYEHKRITANNVYILVVTNLSKNSPKTGQYKKTTGWRKNARDSLRNLRLEVKKAHTIVGSINL